jgi:hypothetical protein
MRSQGIEGLTRTKIGKPHRWFANFRVMEAVAPLAVNHPYLGLQAIIFEDYGEVGTDTVAGITNALPEGRIKDLFRQPLRPSHPSWIDAQYTITMADSRVTHWEQHLAPYRDRVQRVLEIGCYEGQSVRAHGHLRGSMDAERAGQDRTSACHRAALRCQPGRVISASAFASSR